MSDLVQFLRDRVAFDERDAQEDHTLGCRMHDLGPDDNFDESRWRELCDCKVRRRLLEVVAKRLILADHTTPHTVVDGFCVEEGGECTHAGEAECPWHGADGCLTARALALPYGDHPDYREEWKP